VAGAGAESGLKRKWQCRK